jgi:lipopolysaccharide/colanic/teichoic acid biosynthesis glycosyltransferase
MKIYQLFKRTLDIVFSSLSMVLLFPLFLLVSVAIWLTEGFPVFYRSRRVVARNKAVPIIKFRTMVKDATSPKYRLEERFMRDGYLDIPLGCEVYTPIGRLLERTQVVELLQLFNVLLGQMSFIGNRPLPQRNLDLLGKTGVWETRFDCPAGISGISQVVGKYGLTPKERLDLETLYAKVYQNGNVIKSDVLIFFYTLRLILTGKPLSLEAGTTLLKQCLPSRC